MAYACVRPVVMETKAQHYRGEATRILEIAERTSDPLVKIHLLEIAQRYVQLAHNADATDSRPMNKPKIVSRRTI